MLRNNIPIDSPLTHHFCFELLTSLGAKIVEFPAKKHPADRQGFDTLQIKFLSNDESLTQIYHTLNCDIFCTDKAGQYVLMLFNRDLDILFEDALNAHAVSKETKTSEKYTVSLGHVFKKMTLGTYSEDQYIEDNESIINPDIKKLVNQSLNQKKYAAKWQPAPKKYSALPAEQQVVFSDMRKLVLKLKQEDTPSSIQELKRKKAQYLTTIINASDSDVTSKQRIELASRYHYEDLPIIFKGLRSRVQKVVNEAKAIFQKSAPTMGNKG